MTRQLLSDKKVRRLAEQTGLPVVKVMVRGGTDHRLDLCLEGGKIVHMWPDGTLEESDIGWQVNPPPQMTDEELAARDAAYLALGPYDLLQ